MKLRFSNLRPGEEPITLVAEYMEMQQQYDVLKKQLGNTYQAIRQQRGRGEDPDLKLVEESKRLKKHTLQVMYKFGRCQPFVLISRCPYCEAPIWTKVGVFSLMDKFWYFKDDCGRDWVLDEFPCPHLFCVDGALNLNGHEPTEVQSSGLNSVNDTIWMAAEVPFVKPRVLKMRTMVAVVNSFPVAEKYTAYPIAYFTKRQPAQEKFCIGWARQAYFDRCKPREAKTVFTGKRQDVQDYELEKWIERKKLFWLDPDDEEHPLVRGPVEAFPYGNVAGRRNPYTIKDGQVNDLPNPTKDTKPTFKYEWNGP